MYEGLGRAHAMLCNHHNPSILFLTRKTKQRHFLVFWLLLPVVVLKKRMVQKFFDQCCPPKRTGKWQVSLGCLLEVVRKFRNTEPTLFAFDIPILGGPSNLLAKSFKVSLAKFHRSLNKKKRRGMKSGLFVRCHHQVLNNSSIILISIWQRSSRSTQKRKLQ